MGPLMAPIGPTIGLHFTTGWAPILGPNYRNLPIKLLGMAQNYWILFQILLQELEDSFVSFLQFFWKRITFFWNSF